MIVVPKKQAESAPAKPQAVPAAVVPEVKVSVDNSYVVALIERQQEQINALAKRIDQTVSELTDAVRKLEPGQGFSVTVTEWNNQGRIKTLKIVKE